ncbi:MAG: hypothetical protein QGI33_03055, partial [Candidatus Brocadiia bacterium]|nr:hypothetical protein [Candidatus Brocadiia bacterium]
DTFSEGGAPGGEPLTVVDVDGPGVVDHIMLGEVGEIAIEVDGVEVLRCEPLSAWGELYPPPEAEKRGELPFAFPLVHRAGPYAHCSVPLPFEKRLTITAGKIDAEVWLSGRRLAAAPEPGFSTEAGSPYLLALAEARELLQRPPYMSEDVAGATEVDVALQVRPGEKALLADLSGPAEVVGLRLRMVPGALELLRHQVIELTTDGVPTLRMPFVDLLGVSHPWPHAWQPEAGDWVAGIVYPYERSGGRVEPGAVVYFHLPIPFERSLQIAVWNRSADLSASFEGELRIAPLGGDADSAWRLCGLSRRVDLPSEGPVELFEAPAAGRLVGLSMFTTGHGPSWEWRQQSRLELRNGDDVVADGPPLLPLGLSGRQGHAVTASLFWNHNSLESADRSGAGRHFWLDPPALQPGSRLRYVAAGRDGPTHAEVSIVWYQSPGSSAAAPDVPGEVVELPPIVHGQSGRPLPGGWSSEAETLASAAEATAGLARSETSGARDAFASADAYLAWNAERPGDMLDLLAPLPESRYARLWVHRLAFPAGGVFGIRLVDAGEPQTSPRSAQTPDDFLARVLGHARTPASVDYHSVWPHRQAYRYDMPPMLSPAPGGIGRIRFTCLSKQRGSRGYLMALDQIGVDPAPATPAGWREIEDAVAEPGTGPVTIHLMPYGREDFFAWGGREVVARAPSTARIRLDLPVAGINATGVELRGVGESGEWSVSLAGQPPVAIAAKGGAGEVATWRLDLNAPSATPTSLVLEVRCASETGRLLLDAWRPVEGP